MWRSEKFSSLENILQINLKGYCSSGFWMLYGYTEAGEEKILRCEAISGDIDIKHSFDPVSYGVYEGAVSFSVAIEGDCRVDSFSLEVPELTHIENGEIKAQFSGDKVRILGGEGETWIPTTPKKVLFVGNSILLGMYSSYGMCATDAQHDYAYIVTQEILKRSPECKFSKLHGSNFEHSDSKEAFENWWLHEANEATGRPACESFDEDLDLVILQLMDNVNTLEKVAAFPENATRLIESIRARSPRARIIWVYGWYGSDRTFSLAHEACKKHQVETINVASAHNRENEAYSGQVSIHPNGNAIVVKDIWISHPGNSGMAEIARRIIERVFPK